ncbi:hypothetical protein IAD21_02327 [Abditibacteriota bacterium]|nr:hypothetical protein IAD21_02327 [Abditibacteriota bacterium]
MALIVGLLLIILGTVALCVWIGPVVVFVKGLVVFSLLFWGTMSLVIGYASWKGKRQLKTALAETPPTPLPDEIPPPTA